MEVRRPACTGGWARAAAFGFAIVCAMPALAADLPAKVMERARAKQWVTADWERDDARIYSIVFNVGGVRRAEKLGDPGVGATVMSLSRGGGKIAFIRYVEGIGEKGTKFCVMDVPGSKYIEVLEADALEIAWSHDEQRLAFSGSWPSTTPGGVVVLDLRSQPPKVVLRRPFAFRKAGWSLTSQAWSPDNRRLVYVDRDQEMAILDVETGREEKLGPGRSPTWSPDGRFIAYEAADKPAGDYYVLALKSPKDRKRVLRNRQSLADTLAGRGEYFDAALWSPDGEFLLLKRFMSPTWTEELVQPHVLELASGDVEPLPLRSMGDMKSWGGKP